MPEEKLREEMLRTARRRSRQGTASAAHSKLTKWPPVLGGPGSAAGRRATLWREEGLHHEGPGAGGEGRLREWHPMGYFLGEDRALASFSLPAGWGS